MAPAMFKEATHSKFTIHIVFHPNENRAEMIGNHEWGSTYMMSTALSSNKGSKYATIGCKVFQEFGQKTPKHDYVIHGLRHPFIP